MKHIDLDTIQANEPTGQLSQLLREAVEGQTIAFVSGDKILATLMPAAERCAQREAAYRALLARLQQEPITGQRHWTRDELYGD